MSEKRDIVEVLIAAGERGAASDAFAELYPSDVERAITELQQARQELADTRMTLDMSESMVEAARQCIADLKEERADSLLKWNQIKTTLEELEQANETIADLKTKLMEWEEREALVCPEDYSFEEVIAARDARIAELEGVVTDMTCRVSEGMMAIETCEMGKLEDVVLGMDRALKISAARSTPDGKGGE